MDTRFVSEIAARGDAILVVGQGSITQKMKVDTAFLKSASHVLRAMFDGRFSDGQGLSYENPKEICFPEDNPAVMKFVCQILHHKLPRSQGELTAEEILQVAIFADKYLMQNALSWYARSWLSWATEDPKDTTRLVTMLRAALLFDDEVCVKRITKTLVLDYAGDYSALIGHNLPEDTIKLIQYMALERCQLRKTLNIHLLAILLPTKSNILCSKYCDCVKKTSQNFTNHARTEGLDVDRIWLGSISNIAHIVRRFTRSNVEACPNSHISLLNCSAATDYDTLQSGIDKVLAYPGFSPATIQAEKKRLAKTRKTSASGDGPDAMVRDQDREDYKRVFEDSVNPWSSFPNSEYGCPFN